MAEIKVDLFLSNKSFNCKRKPPASFEAGGFESRTKS